MADRHASTLPAPRDLLAGLIHAISTVPPETSDASSSSRAATRAASRAVSSDAVPRQTRPLADPRPLLATLHVLFPALVLPALDLLDRRRVIRWGDQRRQSTPSTSSFCRLPPPLYQIRGGGDRPHVVHLRAWHCTCAFFALQAPSTPSTKEADDKTAGEQATQSLKIALPYCPLAFCTPPCKHLLACLLAEEWAALDEYVVAGEDHAASGQDSTPETLAGIVAGVL